VCFDGSFAVGDAGQGTGLLLGRLWLSDELGDEPADDGKGE
jgi:hypothetical protein